MPSTYMQTTSIPEVLFKDGEASGWGLHSQIHSVPFHLVEGREYVRTKSHYGFHSKASWAYLEFNIKVGQCMRWSNFLPRGKAMVNIKAMIFCG